MPSTGNDSSSSELPIFTLHQATPPDYVRPFVVDLSDHFSYSSTPFPKSGLNLPLYASFLPRALWPFHARHHAVRLSAELAHLRDHLHSDHAHELLRLTLPSTISDSPVHRSPSSSSVPSSRTAKNTQYQRNELQKNTSHQSKTEDDQNLQVLHYFPSAPYMFCYLRTQHMPEQHDILFFMERFFGHCLVDRTGTFTRTGISIRVLHPIPTLDEGEASSLDEEDNVGSVCDDRARKILRRAMQENRMVHVMWSGGIDSTTALVALLRVGTERQLSRVKILYTKESCREYPLLFAVLCKLAGVTLGESGSPGMEKKRIGNWRKERGKWMSLRMWSRRNELSDAHGNEATMDDLVKADEIVERVMREQYLRIIEGQKEEYVGEGEEMEDLSKTTNVPLWNPMIPIRLVRLQSLSEIYDPVVDDFGKESEGNRISETTTSSTDRDNSNPSESEGRTGLGGRIGDERRKPLLVTGEHGDQIFGSMYMRYFYDVDESVTHSTLSPLPSSSPSLSKFSSSSTHNRARTLFSSARNNTQPRAGGKGNGDGLIPPIAQRLLRGTQLEPWRAIMPGFFVAARAIPVAARGKWLEWMEKQTNQAPVPIVSVFDYLWWISFSMKWQHVALRILAADGERENSVLQNRYERTVHFFNTDGFQLWSMRNHHRNRKMSDINKWSTYKAPLKDYIFEFTQDAHYRDEKTKERSLRLVKSPAYKAGVKHSGDKVIALLEDFSPVCFGMWSINMDLAHQKYPMGVPFASGISDKDSESIASGPEWDLSKLVGWETVRK